MSERGLKEEKLFGKALNCCKEQGSTLSYFSKPSLPRSSDTGSGFNLGWELPAPHPLLAWNLPSPCNGKAQESSPDTGLCTASSPKEKGGAGPLAHPAPPHTRPGKGRESAQPPRPPPRQGRCNLQPDLN